MLFHKTYQTEEERLAIIAEMEAKGLTQISTDGYFIGEEHLLFDDGRLEPPPLSTHWAIIDSFNTGQEKPVQVKRTWEGVEYTVNCYATEAVKNQYLTGDIVVGDYVMVEFLDDDVNRAVVFAKVFKTW